MQRTRSGGRPSHFGDRLAQRIDALAVRPHRKAAVVEPGRPRMTGRSRRASGRRAVAGLERCAPPQPALARRSRSMVPAPARGAENRQMRARRPEAARLLPRRGCGERAHRHDRLVFALGDDREIAAVAHHLEHPGKLLHGGAARRRAGARRSWAAARRARAPCPAAAGPAHRPRRR